MDANDDPGAATHATILQLQKMLLNLDRWLEKADVHAKTRGFDPDVFLGARLAPDQFALVRQVQGACDRLKFSAARLAGKQAPKHPDVEQTLSELRARIRTCVDYVATFVVADFAKADARTIELPFLDGKVIQGREYLRELGVPGFYFHVTTAYAILRHDGVELTMRDFVGATSMRTA